MNRRRVLRATVAGACALLFVASCGQPSPVRTLEGEPDLVKIANNAIPPGFSVSADQDLLRLQLVCQSIDRGIEFERPFAPGDTTVSLAFLGGRCEWSGVDPTNGQQRPPDLVVGLLARARGGATLDQTEIVLGDEQRITGVGDRATFDPQTRTLYILQADRLWYVQLLRPAHDVDVQAALARLGRALAAAPRAAFAS